MCSARSLGISARRQKIVLEKYLKMNVNYKLIKVFLKNVFSHWHHTRYMRRNNIIVTAKLKIHCCRRYKHVGNNVEKSVGGVQGLLRVAAVHDEEEAFGELRADPSSRGRDAFPSTDQKVREEGGLLAAALARFIGLLKDMHNSKDGRLFCWQIHSISQNRIQHVLMWFCCTHIYNLWYRMFRF